MVDFHLPVVKVMCGSMFSGLLTADGQVFTWGENLFGQLGVADSKVTWCQRPTKVVMNKFIKDIACGYNHSVAVTKNDEIFVWGRRMAGYPNIELTYNYLMSNLNMLRVELDQPQPRLVKNNLIFYKIKKLVCGPFNTALISTEGDLLVHGMNESGQLAMGQELGPMVPFFPEFRKLDPFGSKKKVVDVAFGAASVHFLAENGLNGTTLFAAGDNEWG